MWWVRTTNVRKLSSSVPRPNLTHVPRRSRLGSMNWSRQAESGVKTKSRSLQGLEFRFSIRTMSGSRQIQTATPTSTSVELASPTALVTDTMSWIEAEPWRIGAIRLIRMVRRTSRSPICTCAAHVGIMSRLEPMSTVVCSIDAVILAAQSCTWRSTSQTATTCRGMLRLTAIAMSIGRIRISPRVILIVSYRPRTHSSPEKGVNPLLPW